MFRVIYIKKTSPCKRGRTRSSSRLAGGDTFVHRAVKCISGGKLLVSGFSDAQSKDGHFVCCGSCSWDDEEGAGCFKEQTAINRVKQVWWKWNENRFTLPLNYNNSCNNTTLLSNLFRGLRLFSSPKFRLLYFYLYLFLPSLHPSLLTTPENGDLK